MSESVRNESISTESICTVIENSTDTKPELKDDININNRNIDKDFNETHFYTEDTENETCNSSVSFDRLTSTEDDEAPLHNRNYSTAGSCETTPEKGSLYQVESSKPSRSKLKKSVSFDPNDEKIRKFITGDPIVDQQNPFKANGSISNSLRKKKTPPPVPTKRSTLSVRKTVTQQLREREREKEKERERVKNETNNRKTISNGTALSSPDEYITTEEVLKQSKYVKTYIKNPDPFFVYDPTVLARIKFEELREIADKKPPKKLKLTIHTRERLKDLKNKQSSVSDIPVKTKQAPTFKKCSKPNYPELADIRVKVGSEPDDNYFNPAEVTKNAKKFDERVKKLHIGSEDDLDEFDEPLTKSESSDEIGNNNHQSSINKKDQKSPQIEVMNGHHNKKEQQPPVDGTFTNTIKSDEFQEYLEKKGLTLIPRKIPNGAQPMYTNGIPRIKNHISFQEPERVQISFDTMDKSNNNAKKPSVFQRLLSNSIFASRRKTTPKETVPIPRTHLYDATNLKIRENGNLKTPTAIKRVVLERQSFHGRPRASNILSASEANELKTQNERSRKSFASGDDLSISISSALTNAEYANGPDQSVRQPLSIKSTLAAGTHKPELHPKPIAKPPRRTLSRDRMGNLQPMRQVMVVETEPQNSIQKPKVQREGPVVTNPLLYSLPRANIKDVNEEEVYFRRTLERQSLIPKRTTQASDKRQVFGRSASMDRNEILKRSATRGLQNKSRSANGTLQVQEENSKENLVENFGAPNGPKQTSTPIRGSGATGAVHAQIPVLYDNTLERQQIFSPILIGNTLNKTSNRVYVDQQEWERLRAHKERTDRELYYRVLQQQQQHHQQQQQQQQQQRPDAENIYEHLPLNQAPTTIPQTTRSLRPQQNLPADVSFIRGSPQRNTFSGVIRNRQAKIIDGRPVLTTANQATFSQPIAVGGAENKMTEKQTAPRSQSVLDGITMQGTRMPGFRRVYESDNETPVILRRQKNEQPNDTNEQPRRIGGILTREEILAKVKEFCRKSLNKTPTNTQPQMQAIYEKQPMDIQVSPVSYASVEANQRPGSRMYAAPQVPQRMQSLPQQFIPISHEMLSETNETTASPIYAHVVKRSSMQSNQSELLYESPQRQYLVRHESDTTGQPIYLSRSPAVDVGTLQRPDSAFATPTTTQYIIVDSENLTPSQLLSYHPADIYAQPKYIQPHQLQPLPGGAYGYITVRETLPLLYQQQQQQQQHQLRPRMHDGRSTPLILDRSSSSQQASQIYWTPQHQQRLQQHTGLLPIQISPRYTPKQPYLVSSNTRMIEPSSLNSNRSATQLIPAQFQTNIPGQQQQQQQQIQQQQQLQQQHFSPMIRTNTPTKQLQQPQQQKVLHNLRQSGATSSLAEQNTSYHPSYEWESGSEAGEVQRIMEHQRINGEWKRSSNIFKSLKTKMSRLVGNSKR